MESTGRMRSDTVAVSARELALVCDVDEDIARYESMPVDQVDRELSRYGIDPRPTIDGVMALVTIQISLIRRRLHPYLSKVTAALAKRRAAGVMRELRDAVNVLLATVSEMRRTLQGIAKPWETGRAMPVRLLN
jgi:hypothetical protein